MLKKGQFNEIKLIFVRFDIIDDLEVDLLEDDI